MWSSDYLVIGISQEEAANKLSTLLNLASGWRTSVFVGRYFKMSSESVELTIKINVLDDGELLFPDLPVGVVVNVTAEDEDHLFRDKLGDLPYLRPLGSREFGTDQPAIREPLPPSNNQEPRLPGGAHPIVGFKSGQDLLDFGNALKRELAKAGVHDATFFLGGSALSNRKQFDGSPFDETCDYDVLVISDQLAERAEAQGIPFRSSGISRPINSTRYAVVTGLDSVRSSLASFCGREVNFEVAARNSDAEPIRLDILL